MHDHPESLLGTALTCRGAHHDRCCATVESINPCRFAATIVIFVRRRPRNYLMPVDGHLEFPGRLGSCGRPGEKSNHERP